MRKRKSTVTRIATPGPARRRRLASVATMLPVALGLASHMGPADVGTASRDTATFAHCALPFDSIKEHHPIDDTCSVNGKATKTPQIQQNNAKNNFCAPGSPINIDFDVMHQLQKAAEATGISFGSDSAIPDNRAPLKHLTTKAGIIGEGMLVRMAAFVVDAHPSNKGTGESVNCGVGGKENNDIHIVLGEKSPAKGDECSSITAEMSPHFRPEVWSSDVLNEHNAHKYRITGQLFFDASHKPCAGDGTGNPKRSAVWEVHPVYAVDMCVSANNDDCKVDSDANWAALQEAVNGDSSETRLRIPNDIASDFGWH